MATQFDPYQVQPDWQGQGSQLVTAWQQALAKLNYQKNTALQKYGFNATGDLSGAGNMNPDGTWRDTTLAGGLQGVNKVNDFVSMDNKSGSGGFRDELTAEANALNAADNGPDRGFSGGLSNQAKAAAQNAVRQSQQNFTQGFNQFAGDFNIAGQQSQQQANQGLTGILGQQAQWGAQEAQWQSSLPVDVPYTAGVSGGGSTPLNPAAVNMAKAFGYATTGALGHQTGQTFKGTSKPTPRGGHAL